MVGRVRESNEWRFLSLLPRASRVLAAAWWTLVALRGVLPAGFTLATGFVVGAVEGGRPLGWPLGFAGVVFVAQHAASPLHDVVGMDLGAKLSAWLHDGVMRATVGPPSVAHLERPDLADDLGNAREFDQGITMPSVAHAMTEIASGFAQVVGGLAQTIVLSAYRWWAGLLVGLAWASTHVLLRESALWKLFSAEVFGPLKRHVDYAYRLTVDPPASKEIRLFGLADWAVERFADIRRKLAETLYRERRLRQRPLRWSVSLLVVSNAIVFWSLARDATAGRIGLASVTVFALAAIGASALAFGEFDWWFRGTAETIPPVLDLPGKLVPAGSLELRGSGDAAGLPRRAIAFQGVRFAYPTTGVRVFDGLDLEIPAGASLAIVGQNGAGKTTLAKLLCRLYDPQDGSVLADEVDLRDLDLGSWRRRIAAVFQDFVRYELSLADNVAPAGAPAEDVRRALEQAKASDLAGLDTVLSRAYDGGTDLSGGQWQRVALARALCAVRLGAGVVILDEPTAQLDVRGEAEIFDALLEATRGLTTILISHRFSTVRHADRICVLEGGRVVELGSHAELMERGGRYRTMFELQAARFAAGLPETDEDLDVARA